MNTRVAMVVAGLTVSACGVVAQDRVESALCQGSVVGEVEIGDSGSYGLAIDGQHMYQVLRDELKVFDIRDGAEPVLLEVYEIGGVHGRIGLHDSNLYSVATERIMVLDVHDPLDVREVSRFEYEYGGFVLVAQFAGARILMANTKVIRMIDFADLSNPVVLFEELSTSPSHDALVFDDDLILYGGLGDIGVYALDDQQGLSFMGEIEFYFGQNEAILAEGHLVMSGLDMATGDHGLLFYDMSNPLAPELVSSVPTLEGELEFHETEGVVVVRTSNVVEVVDVSDISNPVRIGSLTDERQYGLSAFGDGYLFITNQRGVLQAIDVGVLGDTYLGSFETPTLAQRIEIEDHFAYVLDTFDGGAAGVRVFDLAEPESPVLRGSGDVIGYTADLDADWPWVYTANRFNGMSILDVSDPDNVVVLSETSLLGDHTGVAVDVSAVGDVVYVANEERLVVVDVSDRGAPQIVRELDVPAQAVQVHGGLLFVAAHELMSYDISNPLDPILVSGVDGYSFGTDIGGYPSRMIVRGDRLFVSGHNQRVHEFVIDESGALSFVRLHGGELVGYEPGFAMREDLLVVAGDVGSHVYELVGDSESMYRGSFGRGAHRDVGVYEGYAYVAMGAEGLVVHDLSSRCDACLADLNGDGVLNYFDAAALMVGYQAGDMSVDLNGDGSIDFHDVAAFLDSYGAGCP